MNFTDRYELTEKAMAALNKIKENRKKIEEKNKIMNESKRQLTPNIKIEEYSESAYIKKVNIDENIYNILFTKLNEEQTKIAKSILIKIEEDIKNVYELANLKPKIYGFQELDLDSSKDELIKESTRIINEHFEKQYYNLTTREKEKKYKDVVISMTHEFLLENEGVDPKTSLEFAYKSLIVKNLINKINFPYYAELKIKELQESEVYKEFFDSEKLNYHLENFNKNILDLSKIIAIGI